MSQTYNPSGTVGSTLKEATNLEAASGTGGQTYLRDNIRVIGDKIRFLGDDGLPQFDGLVDLSGASAGQVKFPATQNASSNANTLDDYEEGSWTPSLGGNATYSVQAGRYVKIGRLVWVYAQIAVTTLGTGSVDTISGLPFAEGAGLGGSVGVPLSVGRFSGLGTSVVGIFPEVVPASSTIKCYALTAAAGSDSGPANIFQNSAAIYIAGSYETAS
jgi:hypothetical protein